MSYPESPPALEESASMARYLEAYERDYQHGSLAGHGIHPEDVQLVVGEHRFFESPPGSVIARTTYQYGWEEGSTHADSAPTHAPSGVHDAVVVRAERVGSLEDGSELAPDPLANRTVLECSE